MPKLEIKDYVHYFPAAKTDPNFPSKYKFTLIDTVDSLKDYLSQPEKFMAFDLETSGLNPEDSFIVGVALCQTPSEGVYVPINHHSGGLGKEGLDLIYEELNKRERVFLFNLRFDFRMMEFYGFTDHKTFSDLTRSTSVTGYDMSRVKYLDVAIPCYLADTNMGSYVKNEVNFKKWFLESNKQLKPLSLKHWSLHFLGWEQMKFQDVLGENSSFYNVSPEDAVFYAATDALATFHLAFKTSPFMKESGVAGQMDNQLMYILMKCEQHTTLLDEKHLDQVEVDVVPEITRVDRELQRVVATINPSMIVPRTTPKSSSEDLDYSVNFNLKSSPQKVSLLTSLGVDTNSYTPKGAMKTGKAEMEKIIEDYPPEHLAHQFAEYYLTYSKLTKLDSSYIEPFRKEISLHEGRARFGYRTERVPTTRLAGGKESKNKGTPFFSMMNIQSIIKPKPHVWYTRPVQGDPTGVSHLGWEFSPEPFPQDREQWEIEGFSPKLNLRKVLRADEGYTFVSVDFQAQELRIPTNLSGEQVWIDAFLNGEDVHKKTAYTIWGASNYDKDKRRLSKGGAFGLLYGGNEYTMEKNLHLTPEEAKEFVSSFRKALPTLFSYLDEVVRKARRTHVVYSYFGHPRRLGYFYKHPDRRMHGFADRTAKNSPIQSSGADILKLSLIKLWKEVYSTPQWDGACNFISTVHDEINSQVKTEKLAEFMSKKAEVMSLHVPGWKVPMEVGVSVGSSWGELFDFKYDDKKGAWVPKHESTPWSAKRSEKAEESSEEDEDDIFLDLEEEDFEEEDIY